MMPACAAAADSTAATQQITPLYGNINSFYGNINSFYGNINSFYGNINPFYGNINPFFGGVSNFWGQVSPFQQAAGSATATFYATNNVDPFWGTANPYRSNPTYASIGTFWGAQFNAWTPILSQWNQATTPTDAANVAAALQTNLLNPAASFWGPIIAKAGKQGGGALALIQSQFGKASVSFNSDGSINAASLLQSNATDRAMLFLNLYDTLMDFAGTGHADWWMGATGWTPSLAQTQTGKSAQIPTIGMIDFALSPGVDATGKKVSLSKQVVQYGSQIFSDGHGAAVGSLIIGSADGSGVLGVMPAGTANVSVYNPYDDSGTTNWSDVGTGIATLTSLITKGRTVPIGVLNASLGVPGWTLNPGWNDALANAGAHNLVLVVAAGNDGSTQIQNVTWNYAVNPTLIVVGSVGVDGTISNFSNRPGEACLIAVGGTACTESGKLKYNFITAPGELILVSDGMGGHMRLSGTSLAAPLVSGAIALLQSRWPWLSNYPIETASIILKSATPKGDNPGADPVYGVGELNIAASQAPLNWNKVVFYQALNGKVSLTPLSLSSVLPQIQQNTQSVWNALGLSYSVFESVGATYRDFQIPLSSKLVGQNVSTISGSQAYQSYLTAALRAQAGYFSSFATTASADTPFQSGFERSSLAAARYGDWSLRVSMAVTGGRAGFVNHNGTPMEGGAELSGRRAALLMGYGNGAGALDGSSAFFFHSDYDLGVGGVNPILGLASGDGYFGAQIKPATSLKVSFGLTRQNAERSLNAFGLTPLSGSWVRRYAATAETVNIAFSPTKALMVHGALTHLTEASGLLGIQSLDRADLPGGSSTNAFTFGFDLQLGSHLMVSGSGTMARTSSSQGQIVARDLASNSAALALTRQGLFGRTDSLRLTAAIPLHTVGGRLSYETVGVINRDTGEIGIVSQSMLGGHQRTPFSGEILYGARLPRSRGEVSLFGRVNRASSLQSDNHMEAVGGVQLQTAF